MKREGMLFGGLCVRNRIRNVMYKEQYWPESVKEECRYAFTEEDPCERKIAEVLDALIEQDGKEVRIDITCFLVFAMCQNRICCREIDKLSMEECCYYQGKKKGIPLLEKYFWICLGYEEKYYAGIFLGMLEEIRYGEETAAGKTMEKFYSITKKGWHVAGRELFSQKTLKFEKIQDWVKDYTEQPAMGMSQICVLLLLAENMHIAIEENIDYYLILVCLMDRNEIWNCKKEEILYSDPQEKNRYENDHIEEKIKESMYDIYRTQNEFYRDSDKEFDYFIQNLYHMGGIDRNILNNQVLSEENRIRLLEVGEFTEDTCVKEYVYSLNIILLAQYLNQCMEKLQLEGSLEKESRILELEKENKALKSRIGEAESDRKNAEKKVLELKKQLEEVSRSFRRKEKELERLVVRQKKEREEVIQLREEIYQFHIDKQKKQSYNSTQ